MRVRTCEAEQQEREADPHLRVLPDPYHADARPRRDANLSHQYGTPVTLGACYPLGGRYARWRLGAAGAWSLDGQKKSEIGGDVRGLPLWQPVDGVGLHHAAADRDPDAPRCTVLDDRRAGLFSCLFQCLCAVQFFFYPPQDLIQQKRTATCTAVMVGEAAARGFGARVLDTHLQLLVQYPLLRSGISMAATGYETT